MTPALAVLLLSSSVAWGSPGCAAILSPGADRVPVSPGPSGAAASLEGMPAGKTPVVVPVPGNREGIFSAQLPGDETQKIDHDEVVNGRLALNLVWIVVWPLVPVAVGVDLLAGRAGKHSRKPLKVELVPLATPRH